MIEKNGDLTTGWKWGSLGDLVDVVRGVSFSSGRAAGAKSDGLVPLLTATNIADELLLDRDLIWIAREFVQGEQFLKAHDIVMCLSSGSASVVGKSAPLREEWFGTVGAFCCILRPKGHVEPEFIAHALRSPLFYEWRDANARGANIQNLRTSELSDWRLPIPVRSEQVRMVNVLAKQRALLTSAQEGLRNQSIDLKRIGSAVLLRLVGPGVRLPRDLIAPPRGWNWKPLSAIARLESGHTPSRRQPDWWGGGIPWLALPDIPELDGLSVMDTVEHTNELGIKNSSARLLPVGTVALSRTASVGFVTILGQTMATSQDFVNWVCGEELDPWFLLWALIGSRDYLRSLSSGAIHKTIYMPTVQALQICCPTIEEQRRVVGTINERTPSIDAARQTVDTQRSELDAFQTSLLRAAFSGAL